MSYANILGLRLILVNTNWDWKLVGSGQICMSCNEFDGDSWKYNSLRNWVNKS